MTHALLFEFEGVLADTAESRRVALRGALDALGITVTDDVMRAGDGLALPLAVRAVVEHAAVEADELARDLLTLDAERRFSALVATGAVPLVPGAASFVRSARGRARLAIVTRARRRDVDQLLALAELDHAFAFVVAADETPRPKPAPDGYERALRRLGARAAEGRAIAIEDGAAGVEAARAAGLPCVVVGSSAAGAPHLASLEGATVESLCALAARAARERVA